MKKRAITLAIAVSLALAFLATGAAPGSASLSTESIGIVQPTGRWHLDFPGQDFNLWFGAGGDQPLFGDWDCDDIDTPAVYRFNGRIYLTNINDTNVASETLFFGTFGDVAVAGDWDGDGCDTFGIYRPSESKFYLSNSLLTGPAEADFFFGGAGDLPVAGDWDGDGFDTVGVYRSSTGTAYLTDGTVTAVADMTVSFGEPGDLVFAGDWDGDGLDALGVLRPLTDSVHLLSSNETPEETIIPANGLVGIPVSGLIQRIITVSPVGTALQNGDELRRAADYVASHAPSAERLWTIRVEPGTYDLSASIPGLVVPEFTNVTGTATAADTIFLYEVFGPAGAAVEAGASLLEHFTIEADFGFASGFGIDSVGGTTINDVAVKIDTARSADGIHIRGSATIDNSVLDVASLRTAIPIVVDEGAELAVTDTMISAHGSFTGVFAVWNVGTTSIADSSITVTPGAFGTSCSGVINVGGDITITDTDITVCTESLGAPNPPEPGTGVEVEAGPVNITGGTINASERSIVGTSNTTVTNTELGAPVNGAVTCTNTTFGFAIFPTDCPGQDFLYRVNAGGNPINPGDGTAHWTGDLIAPPSPFVNFDLVTPGNLDGFPIVSFDGSVPPGTPIEVFATERWDAEQLPEMLWQFPAPYDLAAEVRLYFSSGFEGASMPGDRVFDVLIDGVLVLDNYDIVADVGHGVGVMKSFSVTTDIDGIDIEFRHTAASANNPQVNGVEVLLATGD